MTKTSYKAPEPIGSAVKRSLDHMLQHEPLQLLETESLMEQWREEVFDIHVHSRVGTRYEVLARRIPRSRRMLVAVRDRHRDTIVAANLEAGDVRELVAPAFAMIPPGAGLRVENGRWKP
jgi:hypothetical protein